MRIRDALSRTMHRLGWRLVAGLVILLVALIVAAAGLPDGKLHATFLDVGQGDAILIRTPRGSHVLVDGGPSPTALLGELGHNVPFWSRRFDLIVLTHPDGDHMNGLLEVLARYSVSRVLQQPEIDTAPEARPWVDAVSSAGVPAVSATRGTRFVIDGVTFTVLSPAAAAAETDGLDDNNRSIVLLVEYGERSLLLTGDAEAEAEDEMLSTGQPLNVDVLKVGHHGSANGTTDAFVAATSPLVAVIQVGAENLYGHPSPEVQERLSGVRVWRTDLDGSVDAITDGTRLWVEAKRTR